MEWGVCVTAPSTPWPPWHRTYTYPSIPPLVTELVSITCRLPWGLAVTSASPSNIFSHCLLLGNEVQVLSELVEHHVGPGSTPPPPAHPGHYLWHLLALQVGLGSASPFSRGLSHCLGPGSPLCFFHTEVPSLYLLTHGLSAPLDCSSGTARSPCPWHQHSAGTNVCGRI